MSRSPAGCHAGDPHPHSALLGELDGVREQILEDLLEALRVGHDAARARGRSRRRTTSPRRSASWRNGRATDSSRSRRRNLLGVHRDGAGFDLREVEDVADEIQEIAARAVNRARELDLAGRQIAVRVVRQLLAENQDAVERRAQLMRHVRQKLGLVLRGQRKLGRLFLERAPRLLDFLVLAFDLRVLLGQLLRLLLELLIRQLQLFLLRLQFGRQLLRLLEQALGLHRRFDAVEHDADAGGELIEEGLLQIGERRDRRELDDRFDLALEQDGQNNQVGRLHLEQAAPDRHDVGRHVGDEHRARIDRALPDRGPRPTGAVSGWPSRRRRRRRPAA